MALTRPDICRVTIVTPNRWADVALPATEALVDLLPSVVEHVGDAELRDQPLALQRLGESPMHPGRSLAANGVLDGETLYLNRVTSPQPLLDFDDAIAGLGTGIEGLPNRWRDVYTRRSMMGLAVAPIALGWLALANGGATRSMSGVLALVATLLFLLGAGLASRAWNDKALALILGGLALPFAGVAAVMVIWDVASVDLISPPIVIAVAAAMFTVASIADRAVGGLTTAFAGVAFGSALAGIGAGIALLADWNTHDTLAFIMVSAVISGEVLVSIACKLAGVWLPPLARNAEELELGIEAIPGQEVLTRAAQVDQYMTSLMWGSGLVTAGCAIQVADVGGWMTWLLASASAVSLLRIRNYFGLQQRIALLVGGAAGPAAWIWISGTDGTPSEAIAVAILFFALAVLTFVGALTLPGKRLIPHWGRAAELSEGLFALTLIPFLLAVLGTYSAARNLR